MDMAMDMHGIALNPMLEEYFHMAQMLVSEASSEEHKDTINSTASQSREGGEEVHVHAALKGVSIDFELYKTFWGLQVMYVFI
jgi:hypothetical protein